MFWRLYRTYLALVVFAVLAVVLLLVARPGGANLFLESWHWMVPAVLVIVSFAALAAYLLARNFARPLTELGEGARRLADGDFSQKIHVAGSREFVALAHTFNGMMDRVAAGFAQLERDREQLRTLLSGMVEGVVAIDNDQGVRFANERAVLLLEFAPDWKVGQKLWQLTRQKALREIVDAALTADGPRRHEMEWRGPVEKQLAVYASRLPGPHSPGAVLVVHDITDLRRLERLRQDFVANVSHELKTPLANIKSSVEVLIDGAAEDPSSRGQFLSEIADQADRQQLLIEDLLSLARIESSEIRLEIEKVEVEEAVHSCLDRHRTRAEAKGLQLDGVALHGSPPDLSVAADDKCLAQILDNLVDNAIKYTLAGGRITVRWRVCERNVCVEVADTGIGIPDRDLPRVFERFYRVDKARSREMGGTGLGLAIVKHMAQALKGQVKVVSEVGQGSTFTLTLPRAE